MILAPDAIENVLANVLAAPADKVASNRDQLLDLFETLDARIAAKGEAGNSVKYNFIRCRDLKMGIEGAPPGIVYHEKAHLLEVFEALEAFAPVVKSKKADKIDPPPAP